MDHHFLGFGSDQAGDTRADSTRQIDPAVLVPGAYEIVAPFFADHLMGTVASRML